MKVTYHKTISIVVYFDTNFERTYKNIEVNKVQDTVEDMMWEHHFDAADVCDSTTGELLMTIEKDF